VVTNAKAKAVTERNTGGGFLLCVPRSGALSFSIKATISLLINWWA
jgi:hypothetical protein